MGLRFDPWQGTTSTTDTVEALVVLDLLSGTDTSRLIELGTGRGRLTPVLKRLTADFVGIDVDAEALAEARNRAGGRGSASAVVADVGRLPFKTSSFTAAVLIRVFHRFQDPLRVLGEVSRILRPGGTLIVSVDPRPTVATLARDVRMFLRGDHERVSTAQERSGWATVRSTRNPGYLASRRVMGELFREAGFEVGAVEGVGLERIPVLRRANPAMFVRLAPLIGGRAGVPTDYVRLRKRAAPRRE